MTRHRWPRPAGTPRTATTAHKAWRAAVLAQPGHHRCQLAYDGCTTQATEADHIVEVADGGPPLDVRNGQGVCASCHRVKTAKHARAKQPDRRRPQRQHPGEVITQRQAGPSSRAEEAPP